jgi:hypothetical protein
MDAAVAHRFDGVSHLPQLARGGIRIGEGTIGEQFHPTALRTSFRSDHHQFDTGQR